VSNASGGVDNDLFLIALRNGWRDAGGQALFNGLAAGYGNDAVGLAILGSTRFLVDITGDERDTPPSPLEGNNDSLALVGVIDAASTIVKFEQTLVRAASEPTIPSEDAGTEYLTEPVGEDTGDEVGQTQRLLIPLISR
jgi:hypothetical protein